MLAIMCANLGAGHQESDALALACSSGIVQMSAVSAGCGVHLQAPADAGGGAKEGWRWWSAWRCRGSAQEAAQGAAGKPVQGAALSARCGPVRDMYAAVQGPAQRPGNLMLCDA